MNLETKYPPATRGPIVVWGLLGAMPFGGMIWQVLHHLVGFRRLGFDVWYVEDTLQPCMHPIHWNKIADFETTATFLRETLALVGLEDRWVYRPYLNTSFGCLSVAGLMKLYAGAEAVFNLCSAVSPRAEHDVIKCLVLLQTDPVGSQIHIASGNEDLVRRVGRHDFHFTYGENIGRPGNPIPVRHFEWIPTRPPVILDWWQSDDLQHSNGKFTTIGSWQNKAAPVEWEGEKYFWQKNVEFEKILNLPSRTQAKLELALVSIGEKDWLRLESHGWMLTSGKALTRPEAYRRYIRQSSGEFTVAKDQNVRLKSGWFSDRSACYLASGRPVITQDTGFGEVLPVGEGLFAFQDENGAAQAINTVLSNYDYHARAALEISHEYFDAERICADIAQRVGLG